MGRITGLLSYRQALYDEWPRSGIPDLVGSARIVALGEPAHGAHEPLAFRNQLFAYTMRT